LNVLKPLCPKCASSVTRFRKTSNSIICERCGHAGTPDEFTVGSRLSDHSHLVSDGVAEVPSSEFFSFPSYCGSKTRKYHSSFTVIIPKDIARKMRTEQNDLLEIAVRKISLEYSLETYNYVPPKIAKKSMRPRQSCPVCGKLGKLGHVTHNKFYVYIAHMKCDGFKKPVYHYVRRTEHPEFYLGVGGSAADIDSSTRRNG
jgi:hypothetical protein